MPSNARFRRSFLTATLVSSILNCTRAVAETVVVDDQHSGLVWDGAWDQFVDQEEAEDGTLTWTNRTGPTVTFTFTGTLVQVFGAFKPVGTWNIQSLYAIDGGSQTPFVPSPLVPQESFRQKFYDSGTLPLGQHTLKVTNLGVQLWIDYFVYDDGGGSVPQSTSSPTAASSNQIGGTKTTTPATRPSPSSVGVITSSPSSSGIGSTESGGSVPSTSSEATSSMRLSTTVSSTGISFTPAAISISPIALSPPQSSLLPVSSSLNVAATPGAPDAPHSVAHGLPRTAIIGLAVGIIIIAIAVLAIVLQRRRKRFQRAQGKVTVSQYPFTQYFRRSGARPRARDSQSPNSKTLSVGSRSCCKSPLGEGRISRDDDESVARGTRVEDVDARLISDAVSETSTPPPSYREFESDDP